MKVETWGEAINRIAETRPIWASLDPICEALSVHEYGLYEDNGKERVKKHWVYSWICTDTEVGLALYTFDGKVMAVSEQMARKNSEDVYFVSEEAARLMLSYIRSLIPENTYPLVDTADSLAWVFRQHPEGGDS